MSFAGRFLSGSSTFRWVKDVGSLLIIVVAAMVAWWRARVARRARLAEPPPGIEDDRGAPRP